ncbi:PAS-domain containing protein [Accumulibacter sp.]|uniref:PAS-domain containing protein n=1 Tax=Accumulibacter sp. TaxID=2053492 RepID=UPI0026269C21|nr:PAS-domain containing protein [Accumulibacter sp.]
MPTQSVQRAEWPASDQLELIQRIGRIGYWEFLPDSGELRLPPLSRELLGCIVDSPSLAGLPFCDLMPEGEWRRFAATLKIAVEQRLPLELELRLAHGLDGGASLLMRGTPVATGDGAARYAGTFQDVSSERRAETTRQEVINQLHALLASLRVGVTVFDQDLRLLFWNQQICEIIGLPREAVYKYVRFEDLIRYPAERGEYGPGDPAQLVRERVDLARRFEPHRFERLARDGRVLLVEGYPFGLGGEVSGFITTYSDITDQKRVEEKLLRQNNVLSTIIEHFPGAISLFDADLRLAAHNDQFKQLLELPETLFEKADLHFEDFIRYNAQRGEYGQGDIEQQVATIVDRARNFKPHKIERVRPNGTALEIRGMPLPGGGFVTIYIDVTERRRAEERIRVMALQDALTGLPNRLKLNEMVEQALERAAAGRQAMALLFLDLDGFKKVNDSLGHDAGDELLKQVAATLNATVRQTDIVARLGGDEFVILLHDVVSDKIPGTIAEGIVRTLAQPFALRQGEARIGVSVGIALYPQHGNTREVLLKAADEAMYAAKQAGRGAWRRAS